MTFSFIILGVDDEFVLFDLDYEADKVEIRFFLPKCMVITDVQPSHTKRL